MTIERSPGGLRRALAPQHLDAVVGPDDLVRVKQQEGEQGALLAPGRSQIDAVGFDLEPAEQPELHLVPIVSSASERAPRKPRISGPGHTFPEAERKGGSVTVPDLSLTEKRVVLLLAEGQSNREIAEAVGIDERTVDWHLEQAGRKLEQVSALHKRVRGSKQ